MNEWMSSIHSKLLWICPETPLKGRIAFQLNNGLNLFGVGQKTFETCSEVALNLANKRIGTPLLFRFTFRHASIINLFIRFCLLFNAFVSFSNYHWSCFEFQMGCLPWQVHALWNCTETALKYFWRHLRFECISNCSEMALNVSFAIEFQDDQKLLWNCSETALILLWYCPDIALILPWRGIDVEFDVHRITIWCEHFRVL